VIKNVNFSACKVSVILVRFYLNLNFLNIFWKNTKIPNLIKIRPVGGELLYEEGKKDRQTGTHTHTNTHIGKLLDTFCKFTKSD
jgi:hypothetical protein